MAPTVNGTGKLLRLPDCGRLLVAADLHGNLRDFLAVAEAFERRYRKGEDLYLLFLGDLLHGPYLPLEQWKKDGKSGSGLSGRPYRDQSPAILLAWSELLRRYPGRIFTLLGNHEHAHIGGPRTSLFARDEAMALEQRLGVEASLWLGGFLKSLPLWALGKCGLLFSHAAPAAEVASESGHATLGELEELEAIDYRRYAPPRSASARSETAARLLGQLLWTSTMPPAQAQDVLRRVGASVAVYGHAVVPAGHQTIGGEQLILSTSFGMEDAKKRVLSIDLSASYSSVAALRSGQEILPLYPEGAALALASAPPSR